MDRARIEVNELNKLYDEIYYTSLENIEQALEIITNIASEKEFENSGDNILDFSAIVATVINILDETAEIMDNEELYDVSNYIREKADKIHTGELDDIIENSYLNCSDDDFDDDEEEMYDVSDEEYDDYDDYDDY